MPKWIHDRADHIMSKNPDMPKSQAFAIATQQAHKLGKTPKGYGTAQGKREAKAKYDKPAREYKKTAATFYRGMGDQAIEQVLREGLPAQKYITSDPAVAEHYAHIGANNVLQGDPASLKNARHTKRLRELGLAEEAYLNAPIATKPRGGVIAINVPDEQVKGLRPGMYAHLSEYTSPAPIPASSITRVTGGVLPTVKASPDAVARMSPRQVGLAVRASKKGIPLDGIRDALSAGDTLNLPRHQLPTEELLQHARTRRRYAEKAMKALTKKAEADAVRSRDNLIAAYNDFRQQQQLKEAPIVGASSALFMHGLHPTYDDIDLYAPGMEQSAVKVPHRGIEVDAHNTWFEPEHEQDLRDNAQDIDGVRVMTPPQLLRMYEHLNRPKDQEKLKVLRAAVGGHEKVAKPRWAKAMATALSGGKGGTGTAHAIRDAVTDLPARKIRTLGAGEEAVALHMAGRKPGINMPNEHVLKVYHTQPRVYPPGLTPQIVQDKMDMTRALHRTGNKQVADMYSVERNAGGGLMSRHEYVPSKRLYSLGLQKSQLEEATRTARESERYLRAKGLPAHTMLGTVRKDPTSKSGFRANTGNVVRDSTTDKVRILDFLPGGRSQYDDPRYVVPERLVHMPAPSPAVTLAESYNPSVPKPQATNPQAYLQANTDRITAAQARIREQERLLREQKLKDLEAKQRAAQRVDYEKAEMPTVALGNKVAMSVPTPTTQNFNPLQRLKRSQNVGFVRNFDQKTDGIKLQKFKPVSMITPKAQPSTPTVVNTSQAIPGLDKQGAKIKISPEVLSAILEEGVPATGATLGALIAAREDKNTGAGAALGAGVGSVPSILGYTDALVRKVASAKSEKKKDRERKERTTAALIGEGLPSIGGILGAGIGARYGKPVAGSAMGASLGAIPGLVMEKEGRKLTESEANNVAAGGVATALGVGAAANSRSALTGRKRLYHGTTQEHYERILREGLRPAADAKTRGVTDILGGTAEEARRYAYATPNKADANMYSAQADIIADAMASGRDINEARGARAFEQRLNAANPFKKKWVMAADVPLWELRDQGKLVDNPEAVAMRKDPLKYFLLGEEGIKQFEEPNVYTIAEGIDPKYIRGSEKYTGLGLDELRRYIRARPRQFATGAGLATAGLTAAGLGAHHVYKTLSGNDKVAFEVSQYSGPLGPGRWNYRSPEGMPYNPKGIKLSGPPDLGDKESPDTAPADALKEKKASLWKAAHFAIDAVGAYEKRASITSPQSQLRAASKAFTTPKAHGQGPSIAQIAKPKGFGKPIPGATKQGSLAKEALLRELVRIGLKDVPKTPRLVMKHRSLPERIAVSDRVGGVYDRYITTPLEGVLHRAADKAPEKARPVLKRVGSVVAKDPVGLPAVWAAVPLPGAAEGYIAGKKGLEKIINKIDPVD